MEKKIFYVNYFAEINFQSTQIVMELCSEILLQHNPDAIYFLFSSPGGDVHCGITLYNYLRAIPVEIIMHNIGSIDSIANVIFLAGNQRYAAPHSTFYFHGVTYTASVPQTLFLMKESLSSVQENENRISGIICQNTSITREELNEFHKQGECKDASFALSRGVITDVREAAVPSGAPFLTVNINTK